MWMSVRCEAQQTKNYWRLNTEQCLMFLSRLDGKQELWTAVNKCSSSQSTRACHLGCYRKRGARACITWSWLPLFLRHLVPYLFFELLSCEGDGCCYFLHMTVKLPFQMNSWKLYHKHHYTRTYIFLWLSPTLSNFILDRQNIGKF